jgi:DNA polymerase I-like protein with 3'-5' exonuclease and polymerase domains
VSYTVVDIETTGDLPWQDELLAVGIGAKVYPPKQGRAMARRALIRRGATLVCHTNYDLRWLLLDGARLGPGVSFHDTKVMAWLLDGTQELDLASLCDRYLGWVPAKPIHKSKGRIMFEAKGGDVPIEDVPWAEMEAYNASDLWAEAMLYEKLRECLKHEGLWQMFLTEEAPFSRLLIEMEQAGMPFDKEEAADLLLETTDRLEELREDLVEATGAIGFNPGSGDQVARFLYTELWKQDVKFAIPRLNGMAPEEKMAKVQAIAPRGVRVTRVGRDYGYGVQWLDGRGLRVPREKHPGLRPTVSGKVLDVLYGDDPWIAAYIEWKKKDKLRGYLVDWIRREYEGRLHGRFDQSGTASGRLAAREPNLQQVAKESSVRGLFRGDLLVGDYAGLEARIAAHFSGDPVMLDIFRSGKDLYGVLAARAWGGPEDKTNENRPTMKIVWLASQYGARGETLAQTMAVNGVRGYSPAQADALLKDMMATVPRLFEWREEVIAQAQRDGWVETLAGRKRHLADLRSADWMKQYSAERQAVSHKVQGSAADIVRRAMLYCRRLVDPDIARICLQVHDEIVWERGIDWDDAAFGMLVEACENEFGFELDVPLAFEADIADSWAATEGIQLLEVVE